MIRKATPSDVNRIVELAVEALEQEKDDNLVISPGRIRALVRECISGPRHFVWVSEVDGKVCGLIGVMVSEMELYERDSATVLMYYCPESGDGARLLSRFMSWVRGRPIIKQVQFTWEKNGDSRVLSILQRRYGFKSDVPFLYWNRGVK